MGTLHDNIIESSLHNLWMEDKHDLRPLRSTYPPSFKLAPELIAEIFLQCSPSATAFPLGFMEPLLAITQICSGWRNVALGTPKLWSNLIIEPSTTIQSLSRIVDIAEIWFERARTIPLTLTIGNTHYDDWESVLGIDFLIQRLVVPHANRLRGLALKSPLTHYRSFLRLPPSTMTLLQSLVLHGDICTQMCSDEPFTIFDSAPQLRRVTLASFRRSNYLPRVTSGLPWQQLTDLCITDVSLSIRDLHTIFQRCVDLINCTLEFGCDSSPPYIISDLTLVHMTTFKAFVWASSTPDERPLDFLFSPLFLPSLTDLELDSNISYLPLASLISRSKCRLMRLSLPSVTMSTTDKKSLLQLIPSLKELCMPWSTEDTEVLDLIACGGLVPESRSLKLISI